VSGQQYLSVADVATRYGVQASTIYEWVRVGGVPYRRLPHRKRLLFSITDLDSFDDGNCELEHRRVKGGGVIVKPRLPT
jgi:excisionase family DNA binding protein